ncbi:hypothetical protein BH10BAC6_BH10BAC6_02180 [soil metagenome]
MKTNLVCTCIVLIVACMLSVPVKGQERVRNRSIHYSQMMIKLDGTVVSTQDNGATWLWSVPTHQRTIERVIPVPYEEGQQVTVSDVLGTILFQGSSEEWKQARHNSSHYGAMLIVTKSANGVSTTESIYRTR